jgi:hypothetical protein
MDGSKIQKENGCAITYPDQIPTFKLTTLLVVISNEHTAVKEAMTYILQANDSQFFIFIDLKSAVLAIQNLLTTSKTARNSNTKYRNT